MRISDSYHTTYEIPDSGPIDTIKVVSKSGKEMTISALAIIILAEHVSARVKREFAKWERLNAIS